MWVLLQYISGSIQRNSVSIQYFILNTLGYNIYIVWSLEWFYTF